MKDEVRAHLHDALLAGRAVKRFVAGRAFADYGTDGWAWAGMPPRCRWASLGSLLA